MNGITNPKELREAIALAKTGDKEALHQIHLYKWYNWYQNIHIKEGTPEDIENTEIFNDIKENDPELHKEIEKMIDGQIYKLVSTEYL